MCNTQVDAITTYLYLKVASGEIVLAESVQHFEFGTRRAFCKNIAFFTINYPITQLVALSRYSCGGY